MIVSMHQPAYLPWLGYFDRIAQSDRFVFLDSVQFEKNSLTNRNRLKSAGQTFWLTVPVLHKGHTASTLRELRIDGSRNWRRKHLNGIYHSYRKAPRFEECYAKLQTLFEPEHEFLSDLCWDHLEFWVGEFGLEVPLIRSSDLPVRSRKSQLVLDICRYLEADRYLSGPFGRDYLDMSAFGEAGIDVSFQSFTQPPYRQLHGAFVPNLSVVDMWMNGVDISNLIGRRK